MLGDDQTYLSRIANDGREARQWTGKMNAQFYKITIVRFSKTVTELRNQF